MAKQIHEVEEQAEKELKAANVVIEKCIAKLGHTAESAKLRAEQQVIIQLLVIDL